MAESYLYTHIGCDNIPSLFTQLTSPASGSSARFEHTKSLWLEYREKGAEPSYMSLLGGDGGPAGDGWDGIGGSTAETSKRRMRECEKEVTEHHAAIELFSDIWQDTALPNLQSLAIGSIYGRDYSHWRQLRRENQAEQDFPERVVLDQSETPHFHQYGRVHLTLHTRPLRTARTPTLHLGRVQSRVHHYLSF